MSELTRAEELSAGLRSVQHRIEQACVAVGRPNDVTLVVVTKTWPASDVRLLAELGVRDVGENREQEAVRKRTDVADPRWPDLRWHFVGQIQTNKARAIASCIDIVHSVDRLKLVNALAAGAVAAGRQLGVFLQVSLDGDTRRGGALPVDVPVLAAAAASASGLEFLGLMAVPAVAADPATAFALLLDLSQRIRREHPTATGLSAGMSGDLEFAIAAGATYVRVGSAVLGGRPPLG